MFILRDATAPVQPVRQDRKRPDAEAFHFEVTIEIEIAGGDVEALRESVHELIRVIARHAEVILHRVSGVHLPFRRQADFAQNEFLQFNQNCL